MNAYDIQQEMMAHDGSQGTDNYISMRRVDRVLVLHILTVAYCGQRVSPVADFCVLASRNLCTQYFL